MVSGGVCKTCPQGWTHFEGKCYLFQVNPMDWADAERHCTTLGANLPSVHSKGAYDFLRNTVNLLSGKDLAIWLGGYDAVKEGVWLWSDGSHFDFKFWHKGEPNNFQGKENCMEMNFMEKDFVNDNACSTKKAFFCQKHL
ncbi:galactose-specific lectin nattectin-like [Cheilinus undulatus]|uniref:galactose-specific lectin nattectin-like n=1 Tax=Cheilinus undulatus TaxID=241271 RepID=UPI001BD33ABE|nr:galactose-specific lectin nattectin-like [Cheilinus undulatus]